MVIAALSRAVHRFRCWNRDACRGRGLQTVYSGANRYLTQPLRESGDFGWRETGNAGQVRPLVIMGFEGGKVQEQCCATAPAPPLKWRSDEVPEPADLENILGGEQAVVTGQVHASAQCDRLAQQPRAHLARSGSGNRRSEEQPHMCPETGARHFKRNGCTNRPRRLHVGQRVKHRGGAIEISGEPGTSVAVEHRVEPEVELTRQMRREYLVGQG